MAGSLGLVMLDPQYQVVYANDEALSALVTPSENNNGCTQASVMQNLQDLIGRLTGGKAPAQFNHAGRSWRLIRFTLPNGAKREQMSALIIGPGASEQSHAETFGRMFKLTVRETEALELFMKGLSVKETAAKMKISSSTAKAFSAVHHHQDGCVRPSRNDVEPAELHVRSQLDVSIPFQLREQNSY